MPILMTFIDAIAKKCGQAKGQPRNKLIGDKNKVEGDQRLNRLLQVQPNPYMSSYDLLYKMVSHLFLYNNAFAYLQKND